MRLEHFLESKRPGRAHSFHLARIFRTRESITRGVQTFELRAVPGRGAVRRPTASGHAPSQTPNPAARSRDPEAVLGYHGDAGFCDYYEGAGQSCERMRARVRIEAESISVGVGHDGQM
ncbi:unnamed protein product [Clavelina lepadiformis]|uniref:Uncharacterized protein n=1 Tax=Clavelina lepadiformis TaxID=159417 RepID=A0ABP0FFD6_CLALP